MGRSDTSYTYHSCIISIITQELTGLLLLLAIDASTGSRKETWIHLLLQEETRSHSLLQRTQVQVQALEVLAAPVQVLMKETESQVSLFMCAVAWPTWNLTRDWWSKSCTVFMSYQNLVLSKPNQSSFSTQLPRQCTEASASYNKPPHHMQHESINPPGWTPCHAKCVLPDFPTTQALTPTHVTTAARDQIGCHCFR